MYLSIQLRVSLQEQINNKRKIMDGMHHGIRKKLPWKLRALWWEANIEPSPSVSCNCSSLAQHKKIDIICDIINNYFYLFYTCKKYILQVVPILIVWKIFLVTIRSLVRMNTPRITWARDVIRIYEQITSMGFKVISQKQ